MKTHLLRFLLGLMLFFGITLSVQATHYMGGEITYECLGGCTYRIYSTTYYDCAGAAFASSIPVSAQFPPNSIGFNLIGSTGCPLPNTIGTTQLEIFTEVTPMCSYIQSNCESPIGVLNGIAQVTYYQDYDFCSTSCTTFTATYSGCCRSNAITSAGLSEAIYFSSEINVGETPCNNSPVLDIPPQFYFCISDTTKLVLGGYDPDGDSLQYYLIDCYSSQGTSISYLPGYSGVTPFGVNYATALNPSTGVLTLVPNSTAGPEVAAVCIGINEFRNGNLIGTTTRDLEINAIACSTGNVPVLDTIQNISGGIQTGPTQFLVCLGDTLSFEVVWSDADAGDTLSVIWAGALPGATLTNSGANPIVSTVTWIPDSNSSNQYIQFPMQASDDKCPIVNLTPVIFGIGINGVAISANIFDSVCNDSTGGVDITLSGGVPPYSFVWSNGITTEDISGVPIGSYTVSVSDMSTCVNTQTYVVESSDISISASFTQPTCNVLQGSIFSTITGGTPPYSLLWSTGDTGPGISGVPPGGYSLSVTDAGGCPQSEVFFLEQPDSCFVTLSGTVYSDLNGNCIQDPSEPGLPFAYVDISPGGAVLTDSSGNYSFQADTGNMTITVLPYNNNFTVNCPASGTYTIYSNMYGTDSTGLDFAVTMQGGQDLEVTINNSVPSVGNQTYYWITATNQGSITMNGQIQFTHDTTMSFLGSSPFYGNYDPATNMATWNFSQLQPGQSISLTAYCGVSTMASLGDSVLVSVSVNPILNDSTPSNNVATELDTVVGPFDPNYKAVTPQGIRESGYILPSENEMEYEIHFQNIGNFMAQYVVIRDTISPHLDVTTFRPGTRSHDYAVAVEEDSILVFTFANINLPDSASDPLGSQGHVSFKMDHQGTLIPGTVIENSAAIYFDFNAPIITDPVINTIFTYPTVAMDLVSELCENEPINATIIASGMAPYTYEWSDGTNITTSDGTSSIFPSGEGTYFVTVTDAFGFITSDSVDISLKPLPVANFSWMPTNGWEIQLQNNATEFTSVLWDFGDGSTSTDLDPSHVYASPGSYTVLQIALNDCGADSSLVTLSIGSNGIAEDLIGSISVVPNPFNEQTRISWNNATSAEWSLQLLDLRGRVVRKYTPTRAAHIDVSRDELPAGVYLFEVQGAASYMGKLMIR